MSQTEEVDEGLADLQAQYRQCALGKYAEGSNDTIEVDEDAKISIGDEGAWVQAWVWIADGDL